MDIRPATHSDLPGILEIYYEAALNTTDYKSALRRCAVR
jgi:L-amino acid N-acyltransferase YncA